MSTVDATPIAYYAISEWKELFGQPGTSTPDQHGRVWGYFPTEPDYCETPMEDETYADQS